MRLCKNCIKKIPNEANKCPYCGKNPNKVNDHTILLVLLPLLLWIIISTLLIFKFDGNLNFSSDNHKNKSITNNTEFKNETTDGIVKTIVCTKEEIDEYSTINYKSTITSKNDIVLSTLDEDVYVYKNNTTIDLTFNMSKVLYESLNKINGISASASKIDSNSYKTIMKIDFDKLDYKSINDLLGDDKSITYKKDIKLNEIINSSDGYTCK